MNPSKKPEGPAKSWGHSSSFAKGKSKGEKAAPPPGGYVKIAREGAWKPIGQRRHLATLQRAIERSIQWVVFESNGESLWERVRGSVQDVLLKEWKSGALQGVTPEQAFFVHCDRTTMTQYDIDHGQIVISVGVATMKPAEFTTLRVTQSTAG